MTPQELAEIKRIMEQALAPVRTDLGKLSHDIEEVSGSLSQAWGEIKQLQTVDRRHSSERGAVKQEFKKELDHARSHLEESMHATVCRVADIATSIEAKADRTFRVIDDLAKQIKAGETPGDMRASEAKTAAIVSAECAREANVKTGEVATATTALATTIKTNTTAIATNTASAAIDAAAAKTEATTAKRLSAWQIVGLALVFAIQVFAYLSK